MKRVLKKCHFGLLACMALFLLGACAGISPRPPVQGQRATSCPNCGMNLKKWAHTNHEFGNSEGHFRTCSIHCLADMSVKSGEEPRNVRVALHLHPDQMIRADQAVYVIGSRDPGTMTRVSKLAFKSRDEAIRFMSEKGGRMATFAEALSAAKAELPKAKAMIEKKRKKRGKIVEPSEETRCVVCNMFPSRYPRQNAQLLTADKKRFYFCSTRCLFEFLQEQKRYGSGSAKVGPIWVHDHASGRYIFGKNAYYVVGSEELGPMGYEAIPFDLKSDAEAFARNRGGQVLRFKEITIDKIKRR